MNPKDKTEPVLEAKESPVLAPAPPTGGFKLVGLEEGNHHIPLLGREFTSKELRDTPGLLEMLHRLEWPHVAKVD